MPVQGSLNQKVSTCECTDTRVGQTAFKAVDLGRAFKWVEAVYGSLEGALFMPPYMPGPLGA